MRPRAKSYQVGKLKGFSEDDPVFQSWNDAYANAKNLENDTSEIVGIWSGQDENSNLLAIIREGEIFVRWE